MIHIDKIKTSLSVLVCLGGFSLCGAEANAANIAVTPSTIGAASEIPATASAIPAISAGTSAISLATSAMASAKSATELGNAPKAVAQSDTIILSDDEVPFGLQQSEPTEEETFFENTFLSPLDEDVELEDKNPFFSDEYYAERLKAIPGPEEFQVYNATVRSYIDRYATKMRRSVSVMLGKYNVYGNIFDDILDRYELPEVLRFLPVIESGLNPKARSRAGACGLWQFMAATGKLYGLDVNSWVDERCDPYKATEAAAKMLKHDYDTFGDWSLVLAAYNCGSGAVSRAIARAGGVKDFWAIYPYLPRETRGYVPAFIAATYIMNNYSQHNIHPRLAVRSLELDTAVVHYDVTMSKIAQVCGASEEEIKSFNPQYRTSLILGSRRRCVIVLPVDMSVRFAGVEDSLYQSSMAASSAVGSATDSTSVLASTSVSDAGDALSNDASARYAKGNSQSSRSNARSRSRNSSRSKTITVRKGDTLDKIAKRYGTTVQQLKRANGMRSTKIWPGNKLKVK